MAQRVERRTLFAGFGARTGGVLGVGTVDRGAIEGSDCWSGHVGHLRTGIAWARACGRARFVEVVDYEAKMAEEGGSPAVPHLRV
jgi:hypothetical protein